MTVAQDRQEQVIDSVSMTVTAGQTDSAAGVFFGTRAVALRVPTLVAATKVTFKVSLDLGVTYQVLTDPDSNTPIAITIDGTSKVYFLHPGQFAGVRYLKCVIDAAQAGDVTFLAGVLGY